MIAKQKPLNQTSLFFSFGSTLDQKHPIFVLANKIDWAVFDKGFEPLYCKDNGSSGNTIGIIPNYNALTGHFVVINSSTVINGQVNFGYLDNGNEDKGKDPDKSAIR